MNDSLLLSLLDKFNSSSIAELDYNEGSSGGRLLLRKAAAFTTAAPVKNITANTNTVNEGAVETGAPATHLGLPVAAVQPIPEKGTELITSPIVATFYASPGPDSPAFAEIGSKVKSGDSLCILEAMKMMNHLEAEFDCEIVSVKVKSGDLVEFGQALFEVKRI